MLTFSDQSRVCHSESSWSSPAGMYTQPSDDGSNVHRLPSFQELSRRVGSVFPPQQPNQAPPDPHGITQADNLSSPSGVDGRVTYSAGSDRHQPQRFQRTQSWLNSEREIFAPNPDIASDGSMYYSQQQQQQQQQQQHRSITPGMMVISPTDIHPHQYHQHQQQHLHQQQHQHQHQQQQQHRHTSSFGSNAGQMQASMFVFPAQERAVPSPVDGPGGPYYEPRDHRSDSFGFRANADNAQSSQYPFDNSVPSRTGSASTPVNSKQSAIGVSVKQPGRRFPRYELRIRQQPRAARACGFGERDRRVIDPPPIIQLIMRNEQTGEVDLQALRCCLNTLQCSLFDETGTVNETIMCHPDRFNTRRLMGQTVASPSMAKDELDLEGCFYCFPDLSCRTHGQYRLKFMLLDANPDQLMVGGFSKYVVDVMSNVFTVYSAKDFPGMMASSALTRALKLQGCNIQVKKGSERVTARPRPSGEQENDEYRHDLVHYTP